MDCCETLSSQSKSTSLGETHACVEHPNGHPALEDEAAGPLPHEESDELHLSPVAKLRLRAETEITSRENHISTIASLFRYQYADRIRTDQQHSPPFERGRPGCWVDHAG